MKVDRIIEEIIAKEGGFSNHPADPGGPTNFGITIRTLSKWRGHPVTIDDVRNMTVEEAKEIYNSEYVTGPGFDKIPDSMLKSNLIDFGVNSGPKTAVMNLQTLLGVKADGVLGPKTLAAVEQVNLKDLNNELTKRRVLTYARIVQNSPKKLVFLYGWLKRALSFFQED